MLRIKLTINDHTERAGKTIVIEPLLFLKKCFGRGCCVLNFKMHFISGQKSSDNQISQKQSRQSLYSLESCTDTVCSRRSVRSGRRVRPDDVVEDAQYPQMSPKPMTPRRVKHRSSRRYSNGRSSTRNSRRKVQHQNPVTRLMDQQSAATVVGTTPYYNHLVPSLTASNLKTLNQSADPIYYNMTLSSPLLTGSQSTTVLNSQSYHGNAINRHSLIVPGHTNETYQHSTPNLDQRFNPEATDDLYTRAPSIRSSYSNYHGVRALHNLTKEEFQNPEVPTRDRSLAFLNSAPPAYNLNYHTPPDSETTM